MAVIRLIDRNLRFFRFARPFDGIILSTVPETVVLGGSGFRVVSRFSAATLADLAVRGSIISCLTLTRVASASAFLATLGDMMGC